MCRPVTSRYTNTLKNKGFNNRVLNVQNVTDCRLVDAEQEQDLTKNV